MIHLNSQPIRPNRIVILGAGGFVGTALIKHLAEKKIPYLALSRQRLDLSLENAHKELSNLLDENDVIVNLAAFMPNNALNVSAFIANLKMAENICLALQNKGCQQFIYFSSDAVYPASIDCISESTLVSPANLYGAMHLSRELAFKQCCDALYIPYTIIRPTQIYGFSANHNAYGPCRMIRSVVQTGKIQLFGKGEELRDFIAIEDVIKLLSLVYTYRSTGIINFVSGNSLSFLELARAIIKVAEFPVEIEYLERKVSIWHRHFDTSNIKLSFLDFKFSDINSNLKKMCRAEKSLYTTA